MKILVIGSKGFIGSHVLSRLTGREDIECWGADVPIDYNSARYILLDSTNSDFNEVFLNHDFEVCINCSGAASVPESIKNPFRDYTLNTYNVAKMLEAIRKHRPECKMLNLSSAAVYGNPVNLPIKENDQCIPVSPYGIHKLFAEQLCAEYNSHYNIQACSLRIFSAYGPGLRKQLLWDIYQKSLNQQKVELSGTGAETRDFIYVSDIVDAIEFVIRNGKFEASQYNVAGGIQISVRQLAENLLAALDYQGQLFFSGVVRSGDPVAWVADISTLRSLGFSPSVSIAEGVKKYAKWLKGEEADFA